jgi:epoxyqueuosine reductase
MMKSAIPAQWVKDRAREIGFTHIGIARAEMLTEEGLHLDEWLHRGYHASMGWMERSSEKRKNPPSILSSARSIICCAVNYYHPHPHSEEPGIGKISRYAWGDDYHKVVLSMLKTLESSLREQFPGCETTSSVDSGPVMDKAWAIRAGIGWLGKHTNVITRDHGSWIFLGEIITSLDLLPDTPIRDFCGSCTKCIDACPTRAIVDPYVVDSSKCLSYLTIEHRGEIDPGFGDRFNGWIFGCDICQDVCPWNEKFSLPSEVAAFRVREETLAPPLSEWMNMTQEEFSVRFSHSAIRRTKREGLLRNINYVMRNTPIHG